ncbi:MAG: hypothetical protein N2748_04785 [candidate division WOR-3 bacterium]|nr:hypothetical protein [candidate division WOR-3 bacterium]
MTDGEVDFMTDFMNSYLNDNVRALKTDFEIARIAIFIAGNKRYAEIFK